jgi:PIN domain nuclease of toxin-antitoxin system
MIYVDTHVVVWLLEGKIDEFSPATSELLDRSSLAISPAVILELKFLSEVGKITGDINKYIALIDRELNIVIEDQRFAEIVNASLAYSWTRDPFDRLIVAQASLDDATLVTRDRTIRKNYAKALW